MVGKGVSKMPGMVPEMNRTPCRGNPLPPPTRMTLEGLVQLEVGGGDGGGISRAALGGPARLGHRRARIQAQDLEEALLPPARYPPILTLPAHARQFNVVGDGNLRRGVGAWG